MHKRVNTNLEGCYHISIYSIEDINIIWQQLTDKLKHLTGRLFCGLIVNHTNATQYNE